MFFDDAEREAYDTWLTSLKAGDIAFVVSDGIGREVRKVKIDKVVGTARRRKITTGTSMFDCFGRQTGYRYNAPQLRMPSAAMDAAIFRQERDNRLDLLEFVKDLDEEQKSWLDRWIIDTTIYDNLKAIRLKKQGY